MMQPLSDCWLAWFMQLCLAVMDRWDKKKNNGAQEWRLIVSYQCSSVDWLAAHVHFITRPLETRENRTYCLIPLSIWLIRRSAFNRHLLFSGDSCDCSLNRCHRGRSNSTGETYFQRVCSCLCERERERERRAITHARWVECVASRGASLVTPVATWSFASMDTNPSKRGLAFVIIQSLLFSLTRRRVSQFMQWFIFSPSLGVIFKLNSWRKNDHSTPNVFSRSW